MALKDVYEYLYNNNLLKTDDFEFSEILARHHANLSFLPSLSANCDELINEINEDILLYGVDESAWVYFENHNDIYIPYDYMIEHHDLLDEDDYYIEVNLKQSLEIFKLLNTI